MSESKTIHVQWVRSGIGFSRKQKKMVRSLGLGRLNRVAELPDTPSVRGLVAAIPHLVRIVEVKAPPAWVAIPEYSITAPEAVSTASAAVDQDRVAPEAEAGSAGEHSSGDSAKEESAAEENV
ncbi:MAG TPA: 50S ribosomal protein L30 [Terriglobia bacterium]|nr:50S ribosomal protein L30 [Terriglobia bacterium]